jgi:hypothetical protein
MLTVKEIILEYIIRPMRHGRFTMNKFAFLINLLTLISCKLVWYLLLVNILFCVVNYLIVLMEYKSNKPELTPTEIEIEERNKRIKKVLSRW